jgi:hypothetical protein
VGCRERTADEVPDTRRAPLGPTRTMYTMYVFSPRHQAAKPPPSKKKGRGKGPRESSVSQSDEARRAGVPPSSSNRPEAATRQKGARGKEGWKGRTPVVCVQRVLCCRRRVDEARWWGG